MTGESNIYIYPDKHQLADALAADFITGIWAKSSKGQISSIALSGGSTPTALFKSIVRLKPDIPWELVKIFWVDERCVPPDHPESNFGEAFRELIQPLQIPESSYFRIHGEAAPEAEAVKYSTTIRNQTEMSEGITVFDRIFLGMGADGHTASIFPNQISLWDAEEVCRVGIHPETGQNRITITGRIINAARRVTFMVTGESKRQVVETILTKETGYRKYPAGLTEPGQGTLEWYLDSDAAGGVGGYSPTPS